MKIDQIIETRIKAMNSIHLSNRIEGAVDEIAFQNMLERARMPISNEEFAFQEVSRIYAEFGLAYVK